MARFGAGMSTESFSSTRDRLSSAAAAVGLGTILRDQKTWPGASRVDVLLGQMANPPGGACSVSNSPVRSLTSSPVESVSLSESDDADALKEDDIWTAMEAVISRPSSPSLIKEHHLGFNHYGLDLCREGHEPPTCHEQGFLGHKRAPSQATFSHVHSQLQGRHSRNVTSLSRHRFEKGAGLVHAIAVENSGSVRLSPLSKVPESAMRIVDPPACHAATHSVTIPQVPMHDCPRRCLDVKPQSAPVKVPDWSKTLQQDENTMRTNACLMQESDEEDDLHEERLPPHEVLAREYARRQMMTSSVCEGHGRTLKGRDMSRVRNAVWRHTGFAD